MTNDKSKWTKLQHWMDLYHEDDNLSDWQLMERGFRHAIEVLCVMASKDNDGTVNDAIAILRDYADREEHETD